MDEIISFRNTIRIFYHFLELKWTNFSYILLHESADTDIESLTCFFLVMKCGWRSTLGLVFACCIYCCHLTTMFLYGVKFEELDEASIIQLLTVQQL